MYNTEEKTGKLNKLYEKIIREKITEDFFMGELTNIEVDYKITPVECRINPIRLSDLRAWQDQRKLNYNTSELDGTIELKKVTDKPIKIVPLEKVLYNKIYWYYRV